MLENWRQDNRIPLGLMALMGIFFILYIYSLVSDFSIPGSSLPAPMATRSISAVSQVSQYHVFGVYNDNMANLPETQLQLTLQGVMLSVSNQGQGQSYAIISSPSVPAKSYKVGDTIPGDATLKKILKDQIVISYQGVMQSLKLPVDQLTFDNAG
jgi:general secretion pathway protein C